MSFYTRALMSVLFLYVSIGLASAVNLGDEFIGSGEIGSWRKVTVGSSVSDPQDGGSSSTDHFYYSLNNPAQLDSICNNHSSESHYYATTRRFYYYSYPHCSVRLEELWDLAYYDPEYVLRGTIIQTYNLEGLLIEEYKDAYSQIERTEYLYDASGNLTDTFFYDYEINPSVPAKIINSSYDSQNRLVYTQKTDLVDTYFRSWQSWGAHSLPDSIYTLQPREFYMKFVINEFDSNGNLAFNSTFTKSHVDIPVWRRDSKIYTYLESGGMFFPLQIDYQLDFVASIDEPFVPGDPYTINYSYSDGYHSASSLDEYGRRETFNYNDHWLLTYKSYNDGYGGGNSKTIVWDYYGPVSNQDNLAPTVSFDAYPNPAKDRLEIKFNHSPGSAPVTMEVFNIRGQLIRRLMPSSRSGEFLLYDWNCRDENQQLVANGVYLIKPCKSGSESYRRVTIIK